jgi:hypothetical protein
LETGAHAVTWWSWDQEAGCSGAVRVRLRTNAGEEATSPEFMLNNTGPDRSGFIDLPLEDQGIGADEESAYEASVAALLADPSVDFVATRKDDRYEVRAARGTVVFHRERSREATTYLLDAVQGTNPIERQDPTWIPSLAEELAAGSNPNGVSLPELGYAEGDPRLSFIEPEDDSYPYGYERIAAYFDHPDAADFMINWKGYAHAGVDLGEHGSLNVVQSRSPLLFWGAGIRPGMVDGGARHVDIAPTVAQLLGMPTTFGVDERGIWSHEVYLTWQDGHPLDEVLDGTTADRVIVLVCDGLAFSELVDEATSRWADLPNFARFFNEGAWMGYGSITNWPSVTYPSHNTISAGVYSGHHGLVDNQYYLRDEGKSVAPINQTLFTEKYFAPVGPAQTLHEAIHGAFGVWDKATRDGAFTASLLDPSVRDADKADLEIRDRSGEVPFPPMGLETPGEVPTLDPFFQGTSVSAEQLTERIGLTELYYLFTKGIGPTYVVMNLITTDGAGHAYGPHADAMKRVLSHIDADLGVLFAWLAEWGLMDSTAVILTSDHGMQIGDLSRSGWPSDSLDAAGIRYQPDTWLGIYLDSEPGRATRRAGP